MRTMQAAGKEVNNVTRHGSHRHPTVSAVDAVAQVPPESGDLRQGYATAPCPGSRPRTVDAAKFGPYGFPDFKVHADDSLA
jgi:hypothetical protein